MVNTVMNENEPDLEQQINNYRGQRYRVSGSVSHQYSGNFWKKLFRKLINRDKVQLFSGVLEIDRRLKIGGKVYFVDVDIPLDAPVSCQMPFNSGLQIHVPYDSNTKPNLSFQEIEGELNILGADICMAFTRAPLDAGLSRTAINTALSHANDRYYLKQTSKTLHHFSGRLESVLGASAPPFHHVRKSPSEYIVHPTNFVVDMNLDKESRKSEWLINAYFALLSCLD